MDALGFVVDPLGSVVSWGVAWLMEHVKPLSDALDRFAGDPDQITAYAQTWRNVAGVASSAAAELSDAMARDLAQWSGAAADAYRQHAGSHVGAITATAEAAGTIAVITEAAGLVVALVRNLVRDLIAEFVSVLSVRLWEWLAEEACTLGIATPAVVAQVSTLVAKWTAKIAELIKGLASSVRRLAHEAGSLDKLIDLVRGKLTKSGKAVDEAAQRMRMGDRAAADIPGTPDGPTLAGRPAMPGDPMPAVPDDSATVVQGHTRSVDFNNVSVLYSRSGALSNREVADGDVGLPRTMETVSHYARLAEVDFHGAPVEIIESADDIAYLDFQNAIARTDVDGIQLGPASFQDEETLVRTLGHESVHARQYADGRISTVTGPLEDEAYAAEDRFVENWRRNSR
nr:hypothetical protein [Planosporangium thailandense]